MITQAAYINLQESKTRVSHHCFTQGFSKSVLVDLAPRELLVPVYCKLGTQ